MPVSRPSRALRHVIVGVGAGVLAMHRPAFHLATTELVAVADSDGKRGRQIAAEVDCPFYDDYQAMLAATQPDITVILTPHPFHAPLAIEALRAGSHVLVEKPMAVHVAEADAMIAAASEANRLLAINFQQRHRPEVQAAYKLIRDGQLGVIQHVDMSVVWPRTAAYYKLASWRGAWAGEGGGVLMNQAPHNLDLLCYLMGMPGKVIAWTRRLMHQIESEDSVQAMLEWPDGALGSLHVSTAEAGVAERLEIAGTRGCLLMGQGNLRFEQFDMDMRQFVAQSPEPFAAPTLQAMPITMEPGVGDHVAVYRNLHEAILYDAPLAADGRAGRMSLEVANAMIYSNYTGRAVTLPLDRQQYLALLTDLKAQPGAWQWPAIDL